VRTQRQIVDYALRRRALLRELFSGRVGTNEVCDASPYLRSAAKFHGEPTEVRCPVCRREHLTHVHYIYGDELKNSAGQARRAAELPVLAMTFREVQVYVVEVCQACGWNHLVEQYLIGRDGLVDQVSALDQISALVEPGGRPSTVAAGAARPGGRGDSHGLAGSRGPGGRGGPGASPARSRGRSVE
jgi:hypothetical protein